MTEAHGTERTEVDFHCIAWQSNTMKFQLWNVAIVMLRSWNGLSKLLPSGWWNRCCMHIACYRYSRYCNGHNGYGDELVAELELNLEVDWTMGLTLTWTWTCFDSCRQPFLSFLHFALFYSGVFPFFSLPFPSLHLCAALLCSYQVRLEQKSKRLQGI